MSRNLPIRSATISGNGLSEETIADLRRWAQAWADDINRRLYAETFDEGEDDMF